MKPKIHYNSPRHVKPPLPCTAKYQPSTRQRPALPLHHTNCAELVTPSYSIVRIRNHLPWRQHVLDVKIACPPCPSRPGKIYSIEVRVAQLPCCLTRPIFTTRVFDTNTEQNIATRAYPRIHTNELNELFIEWSRVLLDRTPGRLVCAIGYEFRMHQPVRLRELADGARWSLLRAQSC